MRARLIKTYTGNFVLHTNEGIISGTLEPTKFEYKLSLKNCQTIERGYDLEELARKRFLPEYEPNSMFSIFEIDCKREGFVEGAKAILEILGDKKFSEEDMRKMYDISCGKIGLGLAHDQTENNERFRSHLRSIQQTEWDVEIEVECCGKYTSCHWNCKHGSKPKLDAECCLILKRI